MFRRSPSSIHLAVGSTAPSIPQPSPSNIYQCSREWPCNHCAARKLSHLCRFSSPKNSDQSTPEDTQIRKRGLESEDEADAKVDSEHEDLLNHIDKNLAKSNLNSLASEVWLSNRIQPKTTAQRAELQKAIQVLPPRSITDSLVQHFLRTVNYNYNIIYPPTFLEDYTQWWSDRANRVPVSAEFTCLLIRALSNSVQYLNGAMKDNLEFELAESAANLHEKLHQSAEALSSTFTPGEKGVTQVQQLFLVITYLKGEGRFIDSWHAMAACVREAQEIGLHLDDRKMDISEYQRETRRRIWTSIFVWDWLMSKWLGRPLLCDPSFCTFQLPTLQLEHNPDDPDAPSPFMHMKLQLEIIQRITPALRDSDLDPSEEKVREIRKIVADYTSTVPPIWRWDDPDTRFDVAHPNIPWQRAMLTSTFAVIELLPLRPFLTGSVTASEPEIHKWILGIGVEACHRTTMVFDRGYRYMLQYDPKHFYMNFAFFDVTTLMCSAMIHDTEQKMPKRDLMLEAITKGLENLRTLAKHSKPGATSCAFVTRLAQAMSLTAAEQAKWSFASNKRAKVRSSPASTSSYDPKMYEGQFVTGHDPSPRSDNSGSQSIGSSETIPTEAVRIPSLKDFETTDFGGMDEMWDWQGLNLDFSQVGYMSDQPGVMNYPVV